MSAGYLFLLAWLVSAGASAREDARRAVVPGVVRFGALFAVHDAPGAAGACGAVREHYGIQRVEATLRALDAINADAALLPALRLGAELRDSCWAPHTALRQTIDLVRKAIDPQAHAGAGCAASSPSAPSAAAHHTSQESAPLLGVLGPGASAAAVQVQNLLQLFSIPQVSYSATSRELSDRARFATFFRVVPSDRHQARLLVALLRAHNWTYVHAVHTDESYGQSGMAAFREEALAGGVCVAREEGLRAAPAPGEVDAALERLARGPRVAVCWCEGRTARALLAGMARAGAARRLRLVGSDGWADRGDVVAGLEAPARGALTLRIRSPYLAGFDRHYHNLHPRNNTRNPWFQEFWEQKFNCSLAANPPAEVHACTGTESLARGYSQEPKLALVVRGVYALAHALHAMHAARCPPSSPSAPSPPAPGGLCAAMLPFNVSLYQHYLQRVRFTAPDGAQVAFDDNGDPPPELSEYDVMSFERAPGGSDDGEGGAEGGDGARGAWRYVRVGRWRRGRLHLRGGRHAPERRAQGTRAVCSAPCAPGQWARAAGASGGGGGGVGGGARRAACCWSCVPCAPLAVTRAPPHAGCRLCPPGHRPDVHRKLCLPSAVEWGGGRGGGWARAAAGGAGAAGLAAAALVAATLWRHRHTPVVKSASRELCALLLAAAALCHVAALAAVARPAAVPCALARLAAPALGGVYAAVLTRTVRIARLVAGAERGLSSRAQVAGWALLVSPGAGAGAWAAARWAPAPRLLHPGRARAVLACGGERAPAQWLPLAPALLLLACCAVAAVRTRRLPHNFNETRFIGAATYTTGVAWLAMAALYVALEARAAAAALCACASLCAGACVALSLGPRVWRCLCQPQRNTRAHFLTNTSIRCHIGKYRPAPKPEDTREGDEPQSASFKQEYRDAGVQTQTAACALAVAETGAGAGAGGWCAAAGVCARVTRSAPDGPAGDAGDGGDGGDEGEVDVVITLLHHRHVTPT